MLAELVLQRNPQQGNLVKMTIHEQIKRAREAKGWSMGKLAEEVSKAENLAKPLTWQTVQQWENKTAPKRKRLEVVADLLGIPLMELLGATDQPSSAVASPLPPGKRFDAVTDDEHEMLMHFRRMSDDDRAELTQEMVRRAARWTEIVEKVLAQTKAMRGMK